MTISKRLDVRVNEQIRAKKVRLISIDGKQIGIVSIDKALVAARENDLDLVEVAPNADPPVCRIMDYGKLRYEKAKREKGKSRSSHLKEIKLRPLTAEHDVGVKIRNIRKFLGNGHKVRVSMIFRGREISHTDIGFNLLQEIIKKVEDIGVVEVPPKMQERDISMLIVPK
ncbi:MAG: translation initiation factor IF-3 [Deltaproteobacteria bacterium]|nr:MAG: translation initiation factor IF-3 [Deltaproteobacteria bacterium]